MPNSIPEPNSDHRIWDTDELLPNKSQGSKRTEVFNSPRIGGSYEIPYDVSRNLNYECEQSQLRKIETTDRIKARLATKLIDLIAEGQDRPLVDPKMVSDLFKNPRRLPVATRAIRLLKFLARPEFEIAYPINLASYEHFSEGALGASESTKQTELDFLLEHLKKKGLIEETTEFDGGYFVTVDGYESIEAEISEQSSLNVFVAMWFNKETNALWDAIERTVEQSGYVPVRVDLQNFDGLIDDKIAANIRDSKFVIVDLTHGADGQRGSVYYEEGFARGLGKQVIQTVRADHLEPKNTHRGIAFDLNHYPVLTWETESLEQFKESLLHRIEGRFGRPD